MSGYHVPHWACLICGQSFPVVDRSRNLCFACTESTAIPPGEEWEPKTDWGRARKAARTSAEASNDTRTRLDASEHPEVQP